MVYLFMFHFELKFVGCASAADKWIYKCGSQFNELVYAIHSANVTEDI